MTTGTQAGQWASGLCNETMSFVCELPTTIYGKISRVNQDQKNFSYSQFQMKHANTTTTLIATPHTLSVKLPAMLRAIVHHWGPIWYQFTLETRIDTS